jgi:Fe-S cluster assembly iron-binding protein IscA
MLTLTPMATAAVRKLVADTEMDEDGGLRIAQGEPSAGSPDLSLSLVAIPEDTDRLIESDGVHVFLEPSVAELLDNKMLDATVDSGTVRFALFERRGGTEASPPA